MSQPRCSVSALSPATQLIGLTHGHKPMLLLRRVQRSREAASEVLSVLFWFLNVSLFIFEREREGTSRGGA